MGLDPTLHRIGEVETPIRGRGGRTYQLISTPHGHLLLGEAPDQGQQIIAEFNAANKLLWQQMILSEFTPLLVPFRLGFYVVHGIAEGGGMDIEKYLY